MDIFNESIQELYRSCENWTLLRFLSKRLKMSSGDLFLIIIGICILLMSFGYQEKLICDSLGFFFPAKWTLKSISAPSFSSDKL